MCCVLVGDSVRVFSRSVLPFPSTDDAVRALCKLGITMSMSSGAYFDAGNGKAAFINLEPVLSHLLVSKQCSLLDKQEVVATKKDAMVQGLTHAIDCVSRMIDCLEVDTMSTSAIALFVSHEGEMHVWTLSKRASKRGKVLVLNWTEGQATKGVYSVRWSSRGVGRLQQYASSGVSSSVFDEEWDTRISNEWAKASKTYVNLPASSHTTSTIVLVKRKAVMDVQKQLRFCASEEGRDRLMSRLAEMLIPTTGAVSGQLFDVRADFFVYPCSVQNIVEQSQKHAVLGKDIHAVRVDEVRVGSAQRAHLQELRVETEKMIGLHGPGYVIAYQLTCEDGRTPVVLKYTNKEREMKHSVVSKEHEEGFERVVLNGKVEVCHACHRASEVRLLRCAKCQTARYCSRECQVAHWRAEHHKTCAEMKRSASAKSAGLV